MSTLTMKALRDHVTGDIVLQVRFPETLTRTDGEFKWRILQAITLALTEKESQYQGADTVEGLEKLVGLLR